MKPIELDLMLKYRYLSGLNTYQDKLIYIDTLADIGNNDYTQRLHHFDPITKEDHILLEDKRVRYAVVDDALMILKGQSEGFYEKQKCFVMIKDLQKNVSYR